MRNQAKHLELIRRRHPEWREHQLRWRWLLDSLEGGERYRQAIYGYDRRGVPIRNLVRHKREYPDPRELGMTAGAPSSLGSDSVGVATDDDYELRRARTPVPTFVAEAVDTQLSRIYSREVRRTGSDALQMWWSDVDGCGTAIDYWMSDTVAPLLLVLGQLDVLIDFPPAPEGSEILTQSDANRLGLARPMARVLLPHNVLWWKLDATGQHYVECLVRESTESEDGAVERTRHWTELGSTLYADDGTRLDETSHNYRRVPIIRLFDRRKPRSGNVGQSRYEGIAERQREYYNRDSELILSDSTQAHPLLQGPEDYVQADGAIPIGPSWLLPKKKNSMGGSATYEGFDVVDFPKEGAESIRRNKADLRDDVDRDSAIVRPTSPPFSPQSGLAKMIDQAEGNNRLAKIARMLARSEQRIAELASRVLLGDHTHDDNECPLEVVYPAEFDFYSASDVASAASELQSLAARSGALPITEQMLLGRLLRLCLPGQSDAQYAVCDREIETFLANRKSHNCGQPH